MIRVLIVEDQRTAREVMQTAIESSGRYQLEAMLADAGNAYILSMAGRIDLILMDVYTLDGENGIEAAAKIKKEFPHIKIIIVTSMPDGKLYTQGREAAVKAFGTRMSAKRTYYQSWIAPWPVNIFILMIPPPSKLAWPRALNSPGGNWMFFGN